MPLPYPFAPGARRYLFLGTLGLLAACSPATPAQQTARPVAHPAASATLAARVDSLKGLPGHPFGEPLRAFPGLTRVPTDPGGYAVYGYDAGSGRDQSWFGRHPEQARGMVYLFVDGQFAGLSTFAPRPATALLQQAQYLLGPGTGTGEERDWVGERVVASWRPTQSGSGESIQQLRIFSKPLQARQQQLDQQRQRAENR